MPEESDNHSPVALEQRGVNADQRMFSPSAARNFDGQSITYHILPMKAAAAAGIDPNGFENLALSCKTCNWDFKKRWDRSPQHKAGATRAELTEAVKKYIDEAREKSAEELRVCRDIISDLLDLLPDRFIPACAGNA